MFNHFRKIAFSMFSILLLTAFFVTPATALETSQAESTASLNSTLEEQQTKPSDNQSLVGSQVTQPSDYFGQIVISLLLVLVIIFIAAWLLRRYGRFPGVADGNLKVLGALSVGQRERILLLQVGKEQVLVGVTSSKITRLHQLEEPVEMQHQESNASDFSKKLQAALNRKQSDA